MEAWRREERFLRAAGRRFRRSESGRKSRPAPFGMTDEKGAAGTENYGVMAMTRSGLPEPPTILRGAAIRRSPWGATDQDFQGLPGPTFRRPAWRYCSKKAGSA